MKTLALVTSIVLLVGQSLFAQISDSPTDSKLKAEEFTKTLISPKTVELPSPIMDSYKEELISELRIAKKTGNEVEARRIEQELEEYIKKNIQTEVDSSKIRKWHPATDIEVIYEENSDAGEIWGSDIIIDGSPNDQKAPTMGCRPNGDIYVAYEDYNYSSGRIHIKRSTDGGQSWPSSASMTINSPSGDDFLFPCVAIGDGNQDKLFVSFYSLESQVIYVCSVLFGNFTDPDSWHCESVQTSGENIRPRITVDTDNYYYIYVTWVEEDWPSADDLYYSRSTDFGITFCDGVRILGGVHRDVDIGWGNGHLYIVYIGDDLPGKLYLIENSPYGNPSDDWSTPYLISLNLNKHLYPRIAVSDHNNYACVVYTYCYSDTDHDIYYSCTLNGSSWVIHNPLETGVEWESLADIMYMTYSSAGDNFHLAYYDDAWIKYRNTDNPCSWGGATTISDNQNASNDDFVAVSANSSNEDMVAWAAGSPGNYDILFDCGWCAVDPNHPNISTKFALNQNYPNPFNSVTTISFSLAKNLKDARIEIYNIKGQLIETLECGPRPTKATHSLYSISWNCRDNKGQKIAPGVYYYQLKAGEFIATRKMLIIR
ncbi:MAG: T9SS type A sorting domain-containing protein [Candidatus Cloacimonetes bacterium]|nr:T9SS type A sorting domain-containing protein [Candidatus Cloacimonadota bacterium]